MWFRTGAVAVSVIAVLALCGCSLLLKKAELEAQVAEELVITECGTVNPDTGEIDEWDVEPGEEESHSIYAIATIVNKDSLEHDYSVRADVMVDGEKVGRISGYAADVTPGETGTALLNGDMRGPLPSAGPECVLDCVGVEW